MPENISAKPNKTETETVTQEPHDREAMMNRYLESSEQFVNDTKKKVEILPNVPVSVLFFEDWYLRYDDLVDEAIKVKKMETLDASEYAEKGYRVKQRMEKGQDSGEEYAKTTYRVTLPNSSYPTMVRDLDISSKKAVELIDEQLRKVCLEGGHTGKVLMTILKEGGATKFDVKWKINGSPA